jgi:hypothetical protein
MSKEAEVIRASLPQSEELVQVTVPDGWQWTMK